MGKGNRNKKRRAESAEIVKTAAGVGDIKKALKKEINRSLASAHDRFFRNEV